MQLIKLCEIERDTSQFQFRSVEFDAHRVEWLINHWDDNKVDPLDVWEFGGKKYLLSGHHRYEAMTRKSIKSSLCRVHAFSTVEEAQDFALTSNANRLQYNDFEYSRGITFLMRRNLSISEAADRMTVTVGMAKKYYALRHLIGTDWETQYEPLDLASRAYEVGLFCEKTPLTPSDLQALFKVTIDNDLTVVQLKQLLRDLKKQREKVEQSKTEALFDVADFSTQVVRAVKERTFLDNVSAQVWWLHTLIQEEKQHQFPPELRGEFMRSLEKVYAYCAGSEDDRVIPVRANGKGRKLRVNLEKAS
ncbi:MAG: hypothetical protein MUC48_21270 [Leptolyngbya sp. Prado105]|jgi:hypothetical protein|nr:hypothetical protein [Leptolyngbya sp. Prado105]